MGLLDYFKFNKRGSNFLASANLYGSNSGVGVSEKTAITLTAVWSAIRLLSESIASLPLNVYKIDKDGSKFIDYANPLNKLISIAPSPNYTSYNFIETMMTHLLLYGNAYAVIIRNGGARPIELKICHPDSVEPISSSDDGLVYYKTKNGMYSSQEMLHIVGFSFDGIKGKSPIQACQQALSIGMASQQFGANFFGRGANLAGVLEHPARLSDDAANRLRESFAQRFAGVNNSHKTAVLEEGVKFKPIGLPLADLQYIETRRFSTEEVARVYRCPLHLLQDLSKSSFNNIEQQSLEFAKYTLMPYLRNWESELYRKLLSDREQSTHFFKFNTNELLRSDANSRADYYRKMFEIGALSPNEIRDQEDLNKIDNGDDHYVPLNLSDIDNINNKQNDE